MPQLLLNTIPGVAAADLTGKEGFIVKPTATGWALAGLGEVGLPLAVGGAAGTAISVHAPGNIAQCLNGAQTTAGAYAKADADGKIRDAAATSVSGAAVVGSASIGLILKGGAVNTYSEVLVLPGILKPTTAA